MDAKRGGRLPFLVLRCKTDLAEQREQAKRCGNSSIYQKVHHHRDPHSAVPHPVSP